jgi:hypothetical protein
VAGTYAERGDKAEKISASRGMASAIMVIPTTMDFTDTLTSPRLETVQQLPHEPLVASLRSELEEYGGLVALFDDQQTAILDQDAERIVRLAQELERQIVTARERRKEREAVVAQLAPAPDGEKPAALADVVPLLRESVRPLVEALKSEIYRLVNETRKRSQQNQAMLSGLNPAGEDGVLPATGRRTRARTGHRSRN